MVGVSMLANLFAACAQKDGSEYRRVSFFWANENMSGELLKRASVCDVLLQLLLITSFPPR